MTEQIHLTQKERQVYFYKLLLLYGLGLALFAAIIFWKATTRLKGNNHHWENAYLENEELMQKQFTAVRYIDSMASNMNLLKGEARQIFLERDIRNLIKQTKGLYNDHRADMRYVAFLQAGDLMTMRLEDLQTLNKKRDNVKLFEQQLEECQIGFKARQQNP